MYSHRQLKRHHEIINQNTLCDFFPCISTDAWPNYSNKVGKWAFLNIPTKRYYLTLRALVPILVLAFHFSMTVHHDQRGLFDPICGTVLQLQVFEVF